MSHHIQILWLGCVYAGVIYHGNVTNCAAAAPVYSHTEACHAIHCGPPTWAPVCLHIDHTRLWVALLPLHLNLLAGGDMVVAFPACADRLEQGPPPLLPATTPQTALRPCTPKHRWTHSLALQWTDSQLRVSVLQLEQFITVLLECTAAVGHYSFMSWPRAITANCTAFCSCVSAWVHCHLIGPHLFA